MRLCEKGIYQLLWTPIQPSQAFAWNLELLGWTHLEEGTLEPPVPPRLFLELTGFLVPCPADNRDTEQSTKHPQDYEVSVAAHVLFANLLQPWNPHTEEEGTGEGWN